MNVDATARALQSAATNLEGALLHLEALKFSRGAVHDTRVMQSRPGPAAPGFAPAIHAAVDVELMLFEVCSDARNHIDPARSLSPNGIALCRWIRFNAYALAELEWSGDLIDALRDYADQLTRILGPAGPIQPRHEPRQFAPAVCQRLATIGVTATPDLLRQWAARSNGAITTEQRDGKNTYLVSEIIAHIGTKTRGEHA